MIHQRSETKEVHLSLVTLARDLHTATSKFLKKDGLTPTRFEILEELYIHRPGGLTQAELARSLNMQPANVLMALRPLLARHWIEKVDKEFNLKEKNLTLSPEGLEKFPDILDRYYRAMEKVYSDPPPPDLLEWIRRLRIRVNS